MFDHCKIEINDLICSHTLKSSICEVHLFREYPELFAKSMLRTDPLYEDYVKDAKKRGVWEAIKLSMKGEKSLPKHDFNQFVNMFELFTYYGLDYIGCPMKIDGDHNLGTVCNNHENKSRFGIFLPF